MKPGRRQLARPSSSIIPGTSTERTITASTSTALASPTPNTSMIRWPPSTNAANTRTMIAAAAVIVLPVAARPWVTASRLSSRRCHSS